MAVLILIYSFFYSNNRSINFLAESFRNLLTGKMQMIWLFMQFFNSIFYTIQENCKI